MATLSHIVQSLTESHSTLSLLSLFVAAIILCFIGPLTRLVIKFAQQYTSLTLTSKSSLFSTPPQLPHISSTIPWIGHLFGFQYGGTAYLNRLFSSTPFPVFTINMPFKIIMVNPAFDRNLARHVSDTGLAQILAHVGPRVFNLSRDTINLILNTDPRPLHKVEFSDRHNHQQLTKRSSEFIWHQMNQLPQESEVDLAHWLFGLSVSATASAVWGPENPWRMDREFAENFMILSETFDSLSRPVASLTAREAYKARKFLNARLKSFHAEHRASRVKSVAHAINAIAQSDPNWESNPDYFNIEMVSALGLLATPSTLSVWLIRHLLTEPELMKIIVEEVKKLHVIREMDSTRLDLDNIRDVCPWLVASWYENLRLHMTAVPRIARHDFTFAAAAAELSVSQGDIFLLPMCTSNLDAADWGDDALSFSPRRFIQADGQLSNSMTRKVKGFGVAGNLCPGRVFGFEVAMAIVAGALRAFEIDSVDGEKFDVPSVRKGMNVGFERYASDVRVRLHKRLV